LLNTPKSAEAHLMQAKASMLHAGKGTEFENRLKLLRENPAEYLRMFPNEPKENQLTAIAAKVYLENEQMLKAKFPTLDSYLAHQGLTGRGIATDTNKFPVTVNGKTYAFPTQKQADDYKAAADKATAGTK
jgi:hypothetical protein